MSLTLVGNVKKRRIDRGYRVTGFFQFSTTSASGNLPIDNDVPFLTAAPVIVQIQAQDFSAPSSAVQDAVGTVSASAAFLMRMPIAGVISSASFTVDTTVAADAANIWNVGVINHSNTDAVVADIAAAANSNTTTTGSAFTADTARALTLTSTTADKTVAAGDVLEWTFTKNSSAANLVELNLRMAITPASTGDRSLREIVYANVTSLLVTSGQQAGLILPTYDSTLRYATVPIVRSGDNLTSALTCGFSYEGSY